MAKKNSAEINDVDLAPAPAGFFRFSPAFRKVGQASSATY
jgi:hypothetical protein